MRKHFNISVVLSLCLYLAAGPLLAMSYSRRDSKLPSERTVRGRLGINRDRKPAIVPARPTKQTAALPAGQSSTLLPDGQLLLIGGEGPDGPLAAMEFKTPDNNDAVQVAGRLRRARAWHSATLLPDGSVLIFGGVNARGQVIEDAEVFDPETRTSAILPALGLTPRACHTATLLTDGRVLFIGGVSGKNRLQGTMEFWDSQTKTVSSVPFKLQTARQKHAAALQPDGTVLIFGGIGKDGIKPDGGEIYDPLKQSLRWASGPAPRQDDQSAPYLTASSPEDNEASVAAGRRIALRFSKSLQAQTVNSETVALNGPPGKVAAKIVPAEDGMLAFITPRKPLLEGTTYTVSINGATDRSGVPLPPISITFTTDGTVKQEPAPLSPDDGQPPGQRPDALATNSSSAPLQAAPGVTALAGRVLALNGRPLARVTLQVGEKAVVTDETGRFLLESLTPGRQGLVIRGETASTPGTTYGTFEVLADIDGDKTNVLPYNIWLPALDEAHATRLSASNTRETVVTNPLVPGMEVRIPANSVLRMPPGHGMNLMHGNMTHDMTSLAITPMPADRPPFPLPAGLTDAFLFTLQMHGAKVQGPHGEKRPGLRIIFPNYAGLAAGERVDFWNYDSSTVGWYLYGHGTVTPDRRQVVPDAGVELESMHCVSAMGWSGTAPATGPAPGDGSSDGDPVDLGTGLFVYNKTDLVLPDIIPTALTRTYRQNDGGIRSFGIGTTNPYEMYIVGDNSNYGELILPDGGRIRYNKDTTRTDGAFGEHLSTPSRFYKSVLKWIPNPSVWQIKLTDGTVYEFYVRFGSILNGSTARAELQSIRDRYGNTLKIERDIRQGSDLRINKITTPNGRWIELAYDSGGRINQAKDNVGRAVAYEYDTAGRLWKVTDVSGHVTEYAYDAAHRMTTIKDARGIVYLINEYDDFGRVRKQTQADGTTYQFAYTNCGTPPYTDCSNGLKIRQTDVTNPRGLQRRVVFNTSGYSVSDTAAVGTTEQQSYTIERQAGTNLIDRVIDPLGYRTKHTYDALGNILTITGMENTAAAATTTFTYEPLYNQLATVTDPLNHTTTYAYANGVLQSVIDPLGHQTSFAINANGQVASVTDALQHTTGFEYDAGDLVKVTDPLGRSMSRYIDGAGRVARITNTLGQVTRYEYDALNQPKKVVDPKHGETSFTYDENGNLKSVTDARGKVTSYTYDNMDRVKTRTDPLLKVEQYDYEAGMLKKYTDRRGKVTFYDYDNLSRAKLVGFGTTGEGAGATYESTISYTYDELSRLKTALDSQSGTMTRSYDDLARTMSETSPQGVVSYTADAAGRLTSMTASGQAAVSYSYDNANRLEQITQGAAAVTFAYDEVNRRAWLTLPNGDKTEYGYDAASQLKTLTYKRGTTTLGTLTYDYDTLGRRTGMGGSFARSLSPAPMGTPVYNDANQLTQRGAATLTYDENGNLTSDGANSYTWNARNQLSSISGQITASFSYDSFGRRTAKTVNGQSLSYLYDGSNIVQEQAGGSNVNLLNGAVDEVFSRSEGTSTWSPLRDGLGSTLALADGAGSVASEYTYGAFGQTAQTGTNNSNASQYTSRENDGTELQFNRARYYSPSLQRFISEDPIGFEGGMNFYAYVHNDPTNATDPYGLQDMGAAYRQGPPTWDILKYIYTGDGHASDEVYDAAVKGGGEWFYHNSPVRGIFIFGGAEVGHWEGLGLVGGSVDDGVYGGFLTARELRPGGAVGGEYIYSSKGSWSGSPIVLADPGKGYGGFKSADGGGLFFYKSLGFKKFKVFAGIGIDGDSENAWKLGRWWWHALTGRGCAPY